MQATKVNDLVIFRMSSQFPIYQGYSDEYTTQMSFYAIHGGLQYLSHYNLNASWRYVLATITSTTFYLRNIGVNYPVADIIELE